VSILHNLARETKRPHTNILPDARRLLRPFVLSPDGSKSLPTKRYYDIFSWFITQFAFCFVTTPFILLTFTDSIRAWAAVWFYAIVGVSITGAFTLSPGKRWLQRKLKARGQRPGLQRAESHESLQGATLGVPTDPGVEFDEMVDEIVEEVRKRRGGKPLPNPAEVRLQVERTLSAKAKEARETVAPEVAKAR
jgi:lysophospholipid acyltransferase